MDGRNAVQLRRGVTPLNAWAFSFACAIGWGAFVMPATFFLKQGGLRGSILAFVAAMPAMIAIALNFHYLSSIREGGGDFFSLLENAVNQEYAFSASWAISFAYLCAVPMNARALANLVRTLLEQLFHVEFHLTVIDSNHLLVDMLLMIAAIAVFGWLNVRGIRSAGTAQTVLALILLVGVTALALLALGQKVPTYQGRQIPSYSSGNDPTLSFFRIFVMIPWAFFGFEALPMLSRELNFPAKKIGRIMVLALLTGTFLYLACIFITLCGIPGGAAAWPDYLDHLGSQHGLKSFPVVDASLRLFGKPGLIVSLLAALAAILTGMIGFFAIASRLFLSMAEKRVLFPPLARLRPETKTPANAIWFLALTSVVISFLANSFTIMEEIASICTACAYGLCSAAALYQARRRGSRRYMLTGALGLLCCVIWVLLLLIPVPGWKLAISGKATICLAVWIFFGIGAYTYSRVSPELIQEVEKNA